MTEVSQLEAYYIPTGPGESELTEKRSTFLGHVRCVESEDEAKEFIAAMKKQYHDARHNCWCYRIQDGPERYSDDGEPQGSAGIPMLEVLKRENMTNAVCVVTRYFGGVLLGTGGLLRAYTKSTKDALTAAGRSAVNVWAQVDIACSYALFERAKGAVTALGGAVDGLDYGADVTLHALLPQDKVETLQNQIRDLSAGSAEAVVAGQVRKAVPLEGDLP